MTPIDAIAEYRSLTEDTDRLPAPPAFTFGTFPAALAAAYYGATHLHGMGVYVARDIGMFRRVFVGRDGGIIGGACVQVHPAHAETLREAAAARHETGQRRRITARAAAIVTPGSGHLIYGHWMADMMPRVALLHLAGFDTASLVYPIPEKTPPFARAMLAAAGIPAACLLPVGEDEILQCDELLIPRYPHNGNRYTSLLPDISAWLRARYASTVGDVRRATSPRIFLCRSGGNRALRNRAAIQRLAREAGFALVLPERLTFAQQLMLFENAREIMGEYGSTFHTAMFSPPGTVLCALRGNAAHPQFIQSGMADALDQRLGFVFGINVDKPSRYDYVLKPDAVAEALRLVFGGRSRLARPAGGTMLQ